MIHKDRLKERDTNLDIIRIVAACSVMYIHFYLNNGFYKQPIMGRRMYVMILMRTPVMICVPLFMILTGYLMSGRRFSIQSIRGLAKNLYIYVLASIFCGVYKRLNATQLITGILNYSDSDYSWYIEMYIGLFLLSPLLNQAYHGFSSKKEKRLMACALLAITALPNIVNLYTKIVPAWWASFYPITYYYLGCYLREFPLQLKAKTCAGIFLLISFLLSTAHYVSLYGEAGQPSWLTFGSLYVVILSVTAFSFIKELPLNGISEKGKFLLAKVAELSLGAYLVSAAVDRYVYPKLNAAVLDMPLRLNYFPIVVPFTIIVSYMISAVLQIVCDITFPNMHLFKKKT